MHAGGEALPPAAAAQADHPATADAADLVAPDVVPVRRPESGGIEVGAAYVRGVPTARDEIHFTLRAGVSNESRGSSSSADVLRH